MKKLLSLILALALVAAFGVFALASGEDTTADQGSGTISGENGDPSEEIGDYSVVIDSCRLAKSWDDKDVVIVKYIFTNNNSEESANFMFAFDTEVYQGGVGLNEAYLLADSANYDSANQTKDIKKGASIDVEVAYELNDTTTDIEVEVQELISFDDTTITKTFSLK